MSRQGAQDIARQPGSLPIEIDRDGAPPPGLRALSLGFGLSSDVAAYLALALRRQLPLATPDADLRAAAFAAEVGRF
jgi:hypothetical protein